MARRVGRWELEPVPIGSGSFAIVWKARNLDSGQLGAVKEINTDKLSPKLHESLQSEIAVLRQTRHRNIVGMLDLIEEPGKMFLVLEFCSGGDLGQYLRQYRCLSEHAARYLMLQLSAGLRELHQLNVLHRDLKPQNLLLSDTSQQPILKIADFGFARNLQPQGMAETLCGSPLYMAPEILQSHKYDTKADLWSVGTILHEMLTGRPPFTGTNHIQLLHNIQRLEPRLSEALPHHLSPPCRQLLLQLLRHQPHQRISFEHFFEHPFLQQQPAGAGAEHPFLQQQPAGREEASMAPSPPRQRRHGQQPQQDGERQAHRQQQQHEAEGQQGWLGGPHVYPDQGAARSGMHRQPALTGPAAAGPRVPGPAYQHPQGWHQGKAHPLELSRTDPDSEGEYVVVSGSSSPLACSEMGAGPGARYAAQASASALVSTSAPAQPGAARGPARHGGRRAAPAMASMATAWAAAAAQAMASVARSVQQPHGFGHGPPSAAADRHRQQQQQQGRGVFYYPQLPSSQLLPSAEPETNPEPPSAPGLAGSGRAPASMQPASGVGSLGSRGGSSVSQAEGGAGGSLASGSGASEHQQRPGSVEPSAVPRQRGQLGDPLGPPPASPPLSQPGAVDLRLLAQQVRLPAHLDPADLLQRVILLLTESVRGRIAAAEAAELAAEEAEGEGAGWDEGAEAELRRKERRREAQADSGALPGQLLSLYLYSGQLLEAGLAAALGAGRGGEAPAASAVASAAVGVPPSLIGSRVGSEGGSQLQTSSASIRTAGATAGLAGATAGLAGATAGLAGATAGLAGATAGLVELGELDEAAAKEVGVGAGVGSELGDEAGGGLHRPSPAPDFRLLVLLKQLGKTLLACLEGRSLRELRTQVAGAGGGDAVPPAAHMVLDSALRFGRAAAADEMLGLLPLGVEGYARAADLLLFLLTDLAAPAGGGGGAGSGGAAAAAAAALLLPEPLRPRLCPEQRQRVYTVYAAVKLRQVSCMAALNAQLRGS